MEASLVMQHKIPDSFPGRGLGACKSELGHDEMKTTRNFRVIRILRSLGLSSRLTTAVSFAVCIVGCQGITDTKLPDGVVGPSAYNNLEGATRLTQAARGELAKVIVGYVVSAGLLTDELNRIDIGASTTFASNDQRSGHWAFPARQSGSPHTVRALARLARGVVGKYVQGETSVWQALLFMYEAYAEILLADGWCSGVPLSTLDFEGDWTYRPGSTTDEIYAHAIQLLDSADAGAADSASVQSSIRVLKARALLALGRYGEAKQTIQSIDGAFRYTVRITFDGGRRSDPNFVQYNIFLGSASVSDNEGINGLPYLSWRDPRTASVQRAYRGKQSWFPVKYLTSGDSSTFTVASGIEARLIVAEAALHENDPQQMLTVLNALRTTGTYTLSGSDTLWNAGIGGVAGLRPLTLPVTTEAQRQLLFTERAAWLFVTGSRQGDLRRLVRKYGIDREQVYPTGAYANGRYGTDIEFGIAAEEFRNPLFTGCRYDE